MKYLIWSMVALTFALSVIGAQAADTLSAPTGCVVMAVFEDHSARATCAGGYVAGYDPDDGTWDIPYAIDTISVGPDANGKYWDWAVYD